jgi:hypothetical protein
LRRSLLVDATGRVPSEGSSHASAIIAGYVPKCLMSDGPLVTFENALAMAWMQEQFMM